MRILMVSPEPSTSDYGNGVTARRWAGFLHDLGHQVRISGGCDGERYDALVALHAGRSATAILEFAAAQPDAPIVIGLTGTDLYPDFASNGVRRDVLELADRFVTLQAHGVNQLPPELRDRAVVITQSQPPLGQRLPPRPDRFEVAFLAHVRPVKDPLLPAAAVRKLPATSRIVVTHAGAARDQEFHDLVTAEAAANPRYEWLGALPREEALAVLARSRLLVLTSRHEGGANVVTEALALGVPVISTEIPGSVGLLGAEYGGYFPVGDADALASALDAAEHNWDGYYDRISAQCQALRFLTDEDREVRAWAQLMAQVAGSRQAPDYEGGQ